MIRLLKLKNFKLFKDYEIKFDKIQLLIGGNNSGKTSIFHALQIFFWCIEQTLDLTGQNVILKKTQLPEIGAIPYFQEYQGYRIHQYSRETFSILPF